MPSSKDISDKADDTYNDLKKSSDKVYAAGKKKIMDAESCFEDFSHNMIKEIQEKPIRSVLIAGLIGFVFSKFL